MKTKATRIIKTLGRWLLTVLYLPFFFVGGAIYYLSKIVRIIGFYLMLMPGSARNERAGFWRVWSSIDDLLGK